MATPDTQTWEQILVSSILTGGVIQYAYKAYVARMRRPTHALLRQGDVDASIATVALARDELEADNSRLRETYASDRMQWMAERTDLLLRWTNERNLWLADQARYREDIARLETQIIKERAEAAQAARAQAARYDDLLEQVRHLRRPEG